MEGYIFFLSRWFRQNKYWEQKIEKPNREAIWTIINYVISISCLKNRKKINRNRNNTKFR